MRYAKIENGIVINVVEMSQTVASMEPSLVESDIALIGDVYNAVQNTFTRPPEIISSIQALVSPRFVIRAFVAALGEEAGTKAWAAIYQSSNPYCIRWMSEFITGELVDVFYEPLLQAIRSLAAINDSSGIPILSKAQAELVISALQAMAS